MRIRFPVLLLLLASACSSPPAPLSSFGSAEPLDASGLPLKYTVCAQRPAAKSAAIYDVYYNCRRELISYIARLGGLDQEAKSTMVDEMDKRALNYAHEEVIARHGSEAVRRTLEPPPVGDPVWGPAEKIPGEIRF